MFFRFHEQSKNKQVSSSCFMRKYLFLSFVRQSGSRYVPQKQYTWCLWHTFRCQNASEAIEHLISYKNQMLDCTPKTKTIQKVRQLSSKIPIFSQKFKAASRVYFMDKAIPQWMATSSENVSIHWF